MKKSIILLILLLNLIPALKKGKITIGVNVVMAQSSGEELSYDPSLDMYGPTGILHSDGSTTPYPVADGNTNPGTPETTGNGTSTTGDNTSTTGTDNTGSTDVGPGGTNGTTNGNTPNDNTTGSGTDETDPYEYEDNGSYTPTTPPPDCNGDEGGTAYRDSCNRCVGGRTGLLPCTKDCAGRWGGTADFDGCHTCAGGTSGIARCDTTKPVKIICDSAANAKGQDLTKIMDSVANKPDMKRIRDSVDTRLNEAGISITNDTLNQYGVDNLDIGGSGRNSVTETSDSVHTVVAGAHNHPPGSSNSPSPLDLYHLVNGFMGNSNYITDYIFPSDFSEFAISIMDTSLIRTFNTTYPQDSAVDAPPINDWSRSSLYPSTANTYYQKYMSIMQDLFLNQHYPIEMVQTYANVMMLDSLNTGVKMYVKEGDEFKQLSVTTTVDSTGTHYHIKICE